MKYLIFAHGAMSTPASFNYIFDKLDKKDYQSFNIKYDLNRQKAFDIVNDQLELIINACKSDDEIIFIGHSFGGVLSVDIANQLIEAGYTQIKVISISSPFGGSVAASWMRLMKPGSLLASRSNQSGRMGSASNSRFRVRLGRTPTDSRTSYPDSLALLAK